MAVSVVDYKNLGTLTVCIVYQLIEELKIPPHILAIWRLFRWKSASAIL